LDIMYLDPHTRRQIAVEAKCEPRTVGRWLRGEAVRQSIAARIRAAAAQLGIATVEPKNDTPRGAA
jgi:DNA-binding LacI/PurR family transcriptional regulator